MDDIENIRHLISERVTGSTQAKAATQKDKQGQDSSSFIKQAKNYNAATDKASFSEEGLKAQENNLAQKAKGVGLSPHQLKLFADLAKDAKIPEGLNTFENEMLVEFGVDLSED